MTPEMLLKLLPEGASVTAVMITFMLGIKYVKFLHIAHKADKHELAEAHRNQMQSLLDSHKDERERFKQVLLDSSTNNKELTLSHQSLMEEHLRTSGEMVVAIKGLEVAVRELQNKVK